MLRLYDDKVQGKLVKVFEMVTMNSNRDHPSTPQNKDGEPQNKDADRARNLFGTLVSLARDEFCFKFCNENDLHDDVERYSVAIEAKRKRIEELRKENDGE